MSYTKNPGGPSKGPSSRGPASHNGRASDAAPRGKPQFDRSGKPQAERSGKPSYGDKPSYGGKPSYGDRAKTGGNVQSANKLYPPRIPRPPRPAPEPINKLEGEGERIAKLLARAGVASRREVERLIEAGRVKVGDITVTTPATLLTTLKGVTVDGNPVKAPEAARLYAFHKPSGLITAERDAAGRPTIYTALRNALPEGTPRLMPIGRLDLNTEGLLLLTNDGELKRAMELPSSGIPRTYRARTFGDITQDRLEELMEGIEVDGIRYGRIDANMERRTGRNQWIELTLSEGKNREVRRVLEALGLQVSRLMRTKYGPFELLDLPRGQAIQIPQVQVERFRKGLKFAKARGE